MEAGTILSVVLEELAHKAALVLQSAEGMQIHVSFPLSCSVQCGHDYTLSTSKVKWRICTNISLNIDFRALFSGKSYKEQSSCFRAYRSVLFSFTSSLSMSKEPLFKCTWKRIVPNLGLSDVASGSKNISPCNILFFPIY